jgi:hypothetical protein
MSILALLSSLVSPTRLRVVLTVAGEHGLIVARCDRALAALGAQVTERDVSTASNGSWKAKLGRGLLYRRQQLSVRIERAQERCYLVHIVSESSLLAGVLNWGGKARTVDYFIEQFLAVGRHS